MNVKDDLKWLIANPEKTMMSVYHDAGSCWELIGEARKEILRLRDELHDAAMLIGKKGMEIDRLQGLLQHYKGL